MVGVVYHSLVISDEKIRADKDGYIDIEAETRVYPGYRDVEAE
jgi:hypothetical protein